MRLIFNFWRYIYQLKILAIPTGIKDVIAEYQSRIGAGKLFPKVVGFEMNLEDKIIVIQILECWMRLTSIRWQARTWNRYESFTEFAEKRGIKNVGHMLQQIDLASSKRDAQVVSTWR